MDATNPHALPGKCQEEQKQKMLEKRKKHSQAAWRKQNAKRQEKQNALRERRRIAGLCTYCDNATVEGYGLCYRHLQSNKNRRKSKKKHAACNDCSQPRVTGFAYCAKCLEATRRRRQGRYEESKKTGTCSLCHKHPAIRSHFCEKCKQKSTESTKRIRQERIDAGMCVYCGGHQCTNSTRYCYDCLFKQTSMSTFGTTAEAENLKKLYETSERKCAYTGFSIEIGVNANVDHIIPLSKGGANDMSNIQWVHEVANQMKWSYSEDQFLEFVAAIYHHRIA